MSLQEHLARYNIRPFPTRHAYETWAEQQLGRRWRQRIDETFAPLVTGGATVHQVKKVYDTASHARIAAVNLSGIYGFTHNIGTLFEHLISGQKRVLDVGCNIGHLTTWYARADPTRQVTGVDFSPSAVFGARMKAKSLAIANVEFVNADIQSGELAGEYDAVVDSYCLKYLSDIQSVLKTLSSLLKPGGLLVTTHVMLGTKSSTDLSGLLQAANFIQGQIRSAETSYLDRTFTIEALLIRKAS